MPQRIISLTPSLTEILFALGCGHRVAGVTDSCDYPAAVANLPNVGCWFDPDMNKLKALKPDLVLGLQTAHGPIQAELESHGIGSILVNPGSVEGAVADIIRIGDILGAQETAEGLAAALAARLAAVDAAVGEIDVENRKSVCRILDMDDGRFHVAGPLSFQYDIITRAGGRNVTSALIEAYPKATLRDLREWDPQVIFCCGFDLNTLPGMAGNPGWRSLRAVRSGRVFTFDCALTCRTGPRIVDMVELLYKTLYEGYRV